VKSATYLTIRCALNQDVPNNAGIYRCITVKAPKGSILNPEIPAAVAARALTGYRVVDTVMGALAKIVPDRIVAAGEGGNTVIAFGGRDAETREPFILVDMINGAWGARAGKDGIEGITNPSQNMSNMPVETLEDRFPILVEEYGFRADSCGAGKYRGGLGLVRQYRLLAQGAMMQIRADRHDHRPYGLFGGGPAAPSRNILNPANDSETLPSKVTREISEGVVLRHEQAGGGGYGDPLTRDPQAVLADVLDEKVSAEFASSQFGVALNAAGTIVDQAATAALRHQMADRQSTS
jgi:N-methylhydantoinase B